jgi:hypothetical protein
MLVAVGTRLWTPWDTIMLVGYEAVAIPVAFFVRGDWQIPVFLAGLLTLAATGRLFLKLTARGARLRAMSPRGTRSARSCCRPSRPPPPSSRSASCSAALVQVNPAVNVTDRWWTARVGTVT